MSVIDDICQTIWQTAATTRQSALQSRAPTAAARETTTYSVQYWTPVPASATDRPADTASDVTQQSISALAFSQTSATMCGAEITSLVTLEISITQKYSAHICA